MQTTRVPADEQGSPLQGADIVCFANDWGGDPLSKIHLMRRAARHNRVLWVESLGNRAPRATGADLRRLVGKARRAFHGLRQVAPRMWVLSPLALPLFHQPWAVEASGAIVAAQVRLALRRLGFGTPYIVSYLPAAAPAVERLHAVRKVYHCVDDFTAFEGAGAPIARLEARLAACSDDIVVSSPLLVPRFDARPVHVLRHGVDHDHFAQALDPAGTVSELIAHLPTPRAVFVGLVAEWIDQSLLLAAARAVGAGSVVVVGHSNVSTAALKSAPNLHLLGRQPYGLLPALLRGADVALIPFVDNDLARASNPLKAREYLAAGLPVVSSPIPEVERLGACHIASGAAAFESAVRAALHADPGPLAHRSARVRADGWDARWDDLSRILTGAASSARSVAA